MKIVWDFMGVNGISWNSMGFVGIDDGMKWKLSIIIQVLWPFLRFLSIKDMGDMINTWVDWLRRKKLYHLDFWGLWRNRYEWAFLEIGHWGPCWMVQEMTICQLHQMLRCRMMSGPFFHFLDLPWGPWSDDHSEATELETTRYRYGRNFSGDTLWHQPNGMLSLMFLEILEMETYLVWWWLIHPVSSKHFKSLDFPAM